MVQSLALLMNHEHCALAQRRDVQVAVGSGHNVGYDSEVFSVNQILAFTFVKLVVVIGKVRQILIAECEMPTRRVKREFEQIAAGEKRS